MVKLSEKVIQIQDFDGSRAPFNPVELQARLIQCFLGAGLRDSSYMAEDIALAVEYALRNSPRPEPVFGRGELAAAVVRMLEETGFPEVAALFRRSGGDRTVRIDVSQETVASLLGKFLACPPNRLERITRQVCGDLEKLGIASANPHLLLELARHYESFEPEVFAAPPLPRIRRGLPVSAEELPECFTPEQRRLMEDGVFRISAAGMLFPCLRIVFLIRRCAEESGVPVPATELEIVPRLYRMGSMLEECRAALERQLDLPEPLPIFLSIPDMSEFIVRTLGGEWPKSEKLGNELAAALASGFSREIYKLSLA